MGPFGAGSATGSGADSTTDSATRAAFRPPMPHRAGLSSSCTSIRASGVPTGHQRAGSIINSATTPLSEHLDVDGRFRRVDDGDDLAFLHFFAGRNHPFSKVPSSMSAPATASGTCPWHSASPAHGCLAALTHPRRWGSPPRSMWRAYGVGNSFKPRPFRWRVQLVERLLGDTCEISAEDLPLRRPHRRRRRDGYGARSRRTSASRRAGSARPQVDHSRRRFCVRLNPRPWRRWWAPSCRR